MKRNLTLSSPLFVLLFFACNKQVSNSVATPPSDYKQSVEAWQQEEVTTYLEAFNVFEEKVFTQASFSFFPIDEAYKIPARFELTPDTEPFAMPTSGERTPMYRAYGKLYFSVRGVQEELTVYQNQGFLNNPEYKDYLFVPFYDHTNGETTYGGGRYLDMKIPGGGRTLLDFNKCYNPYCAYLDKFNCPITPIANTLDVAIKAGMKLDKKDH